MPESAKEGARPLAESSDIGLGARCREFESPISDQNPSEIVDFRGIFLIGYGNHRLCRWRHLVKALALSIERSELQVEGLIKD